MAVALMITGPAGAGKSTAAAAWAARGTRPRALVDADALRYQVRAGIAHPEHGWTDSTQVQWDAAMDIWKAMLRIYKARGIDSVVDIYAPPCHPDPGDTFMTDVGIRRVVLLPSLEVCLERNRRRNRQPLLRDEDLISNYEDFLSCVREGNPDHVVDNGDWSTDDTVEHIESLIGSP